MYGKTLWSQHSLHEKCSYSELFCSAFFRIWTEYGEVQSISLYSFRMRENADQNNSEYGHFLRSDYCRIINILQTIFIRVSLHESSTYTTEVWLYILSIKNDTFVIKILMAGQYPFDMYVILRCSLSKSFRYFWWCVAIATE